MHLGLALKWVPYSGLAYGYIAGAQVGIKHVPCRHRHRSNLIH